MLFLCARTLTHQFRYKLAVLLAECVCTKYDSIRLHPFNIMYYETEKEKHAGEERRSGNRGEQKKINKGPKITSHSRQNTCFFCSSSSLFGERICVQWARTRYKYLYYIYLFCEPLYNRFAGEEPLFRSRQMRFSPHFLIRIWTKFINFSGFQINWTIAAEYMLRPTSCSRARL